MNREITDIYKKNFSWTLENRFHKQGSGKGWILTMSAR